MKDGQNMKRQSVTGDWELRSLLRASGYAFLIGCLLLAGVIFKVKDSETASAAFTDTAKATTTITSSKWVTTVCVLWSSKDETNRRVFTIGRPAPLGSLGWTSILDKTTATTTSQLSECHLVLLAGEAWSASAAALTLAEAYYAEGGKVISTGNDTGTKLSPFPAMITTVGDSSELPFGGNIRRAAGADAISPKLPTWTPGPTNGADITGNPILAYPSGVQCVATVSGQSDWCAAVARTNAKNGRWIHLHTLIGSMEIPGDIPMTDAAITWLTLK